MKEKRLKGVFHYLNRADKLSGIGRYSVLLMGFNDVKSVEDLAKPVTRATRLLYLQPYDESEACITQCVSNPGDERYGLPEFYTISPTTPENSCSTATTVTTIKCHHTRILHIAEDCVRSDIYSAPRLKAICPITLA